MLARLVAAALGVWLMVSPAVLEYSGDVAAINNRAVGPVVLGASLVALWPAMRPLRWVEALAGAWLLASPWVLVRWYEALPIANSVGVGAALVVLAFLGRSTRSLGGGWLSVLPLVRREVRERP